MTPAPSPPVSAESFQRKIRRPRIGDTEIRNVQFRASRQTHDKLWGLACHLNTRLSSLVREAIEQHAARLEASAVDPELAELARMVKEDLQAARQHGYFLCPPLGHNLREFKRQRELAAQVAGEG